jgi:UPF0042 nucleotide-binding protein
MATKSSGDVSILIVTGMSGAGRSTAANALEDQGWYVVDNLPPQMLGPLVELANDPESHIEKLAGVMDVRARSLFDHAAETLRQLSGTSNLHVLFLDATDESLVRRFEQVRRPHPLQEEGTLLDGIIRERALMQPVRELSDLVIDTSDFNVHQLSTTVVSTYGDPGEPRMKLTIMSFGYKYGLPSDVDMVADMRFLPNPYWDDELREYTGQDRVVRDYVLANPLAVDFLDQFEQTTHTVLSGYVSENKTYATIAIGCTGGKHRSVAMAEELSKRLTTRADVQVSIKHRDLGRE